VGWHETEFRHRILSQLDDAQEEHWKLPIGYCAICPLVTSACLRMYNGVSYEFLYFEMSETGHTVSPGLIFLR